jgi:hypothetical protein
MSEVDRTDGEQRKILLTTRLRSDDRGALALELGLPPANALRYQAALFGEPLDAQTALAPRGENASCLVL